MRQFSLTHSPLLLAAANGETLFVLGFQLVRQGGDRDGGWIVAAGHGVGAVLLLCVELLDYPGCGIEGVERRRGVVDVKAGEAKSQG